jgi:hypothetical protein
MLFILMVVGPIYAEFTLQPEVPMSLRHIV